jgi:hypothetical protein
LVVLSAVLIIYYSFLKSRTIRWAIHVTSIGNMKICKTSVGNSEEERTFVRHKRKWEETLNRMLEEIWCSYTSWVYMDQDRVQPPALVNTVMTFRVP